MKKLTFIFLKDIIRLENGYTIQNQFTLKKGKDRYEFKQPKKNDCFQFRQGKKDYRKPDC